MSPSLKSLTFLNSPRVLAVTNPIFICVRGVSGLRGQLVPSFAPETKFLQFNNKYLFSKACYRSWLFLVHCSFLQILAIAYQLPFLNSLELFLLE